MIVKDLLDSCNIENVTSVIMEIASVDKSDRLSVKKAHSLYIQRIRSIEPVNTNHIIFGVSFLNDGKETPDALLFSKNEIDESLLSDSMLSTLKNIQSLGLNDIEQILEATTLPSSYAFEFSPWNEILGYELFVPNVNSFGADKLLAVIIYEMTFCGFTEEDHQKEVQKLREAIAETESIQNLPEAERKNITKMPKMYLLNLAIKTLEQKKKNSKNVNKCIVKPLSIIHANMLYSKNILRVFNRQCHRKSDGIVHFTRFFHILSIYLMYLYPIHLLPL